MTVEQLLAIGVAVNAVALMLHGWWHWLNSREQHHPVDGGAVAELEELRRRR